ELASRVALAKSPTLPASSEPCSTRTILPLTLVGSTYRGVYPMNIVCTTGMIADLVREIGAGQVRVTQLIGDGVDPHVYKTSPRDVGALSGADLILYNGLHLESKLNATLENLSVRLPTYPVTQYIPGQRLLTVDAETFDPHVWMDVSLWHQAADVVR